MRETVDRPFALAQIISNARRLSITPTMHNYFSISRGCQLTLTIVIVALLIAATPTIQARRSFHKRAMSDSDVGTKEDSPLLAPVLQFGSKLMQQVKGAKQNVIFSPVSIHSALNLVLLGAKEGSNTERELFEALGFGRRPSNAIHESYAKLIKRVKSTLSVENPRNDDDNKPPRLDIWTMAIANGKASQPRSGYLESIQKYYNSSLKTVEPGQRAEADRLVDEINDWAKKAGFGKDIVTPDTLMGDFSLLLLSAVRVEAFWFSDFFEYEEKEGLFYNHGLTNELKNGLALTNSDIWAKYVEFKKDIPTSDSHHTQIKRKFGKIYEKLADLEFLGVRVPLEGDVSLVCFMPLNNGTGHNLADLENKLLEVDENGMAAAFSGALEILDSNEADAKLEFIRMPKFNFESDISLNEPLKSMGINLVFDEKRAELNRMSPIPLYVSDAKHQAMIEVTKKGLRAAGVTTIMAVPMSLEINPNPIRVELNNPFLFVVRYNQVPLFMGHLDHI